VHSTTSCSTLSPVNRSSSSNTGGSNTSLRLQLVVEPRAGGKGTPTHVHTHIHSRLLVAASRAPAWPCNLNTSCCPVSSQDPAHTASTRNNRRQCFTHTCQPRCAAHTCPSAVPATKPAAGCSQVTLPRESSPPPCCLHLYKQRGAAPCGSAVRTPARGHPPRPYYAHGPSMHTRDTTSHSTHVRARARACVCVATEGSTRIMSRAAHVLYSGHTCREQCAFGRPWLWRACTRAAPGMPANPCLLLQAHPPFCETSAQPEAPPPYTSSQACVPAAAAAATTQPIKPALLAPLLCAHSAPAGLCLLHPEHPGPCPPAQQLQGVNNIRGPHVARVQCAVCATLSAPPFHNPHAPQQGCHHCTHAKDRRQQRASAMDGCCSPPEVRAPARAQ
jgi:hypothetical protein